MPDSPWESFKDPEKRAALSWLGGGIVIVLATTGIWAIAIFLDLGNRDTLIWVGGGIVVVAGGIWAVVKIFAKRGRDLTQSSEKEIYATRLSPDFRDAGFLAPLSGALSVAGAFSISALTYFLVPVAHLSSRFAIAAVVFAAFAMFGALFYILFNQFTVVKLRRIEDTLGEIKNTPIDFETIKSREWQRAYLEFEDNLRRPLVLRNIESKGFDIFDGFRWEVQPRINILLGRNGYGKTRLLQAIVAAMTKDDERSATFFEAGAEDASFRIELQRAASQVVQLDAGAEDKGSELIERRKRSFEKTVGKMPILAIPDSRFINKSRTAINAVNDEYGDIRENGAYHFLYQKPYEPIIQNFLYQTCIDYLKSKTFDQPIFHLTQDVVYQLAGQKFEFRRVTTLGQARFSIDVLTEGDTSTAIPIQNASQGTLSVLAMFGVIYSYIKALYPRVASRSAATARNRVHR